MDLSLDRISELPDDVLYHILSYLPTKDAVTTGVLSKRWEDLWTFAPNLDFTYQFVSASEIDCKNNFKMFMDYVDSVLFHHRGTTIQKCRFSLDTEYALPYICAWVDDVACHNVQEFTLKCRRLPFRFLPPSLFTCKTLVVLKIDGDFVLNLPRDFCFPNLKTLHLDSVVCADDASVQRLFSSCPILEDLDIRRDGLQILNISVPSLKRLSIFSKRRYMIGVECKTEITAPHLEYLILDDQIWEDCTLNLSSSLVEARVSGKYIYGLLEGISHVKLLTFSGDALTTLFVVIIHHDLPTFQYLTRLELCVTEYVVGLGELLQKLLESSPNLEVLVFSQGIVVPKSNGRSFSSFYWFPPESVPVCLLSHLKTIEVHNFVGMDYEVEFLMYLLESAEVLERMMISWFTFRAKSRRRKSKRDRVKVLNATRGSKACQLEFIN